MKKRILGSLFGTMVGIALLTSCQNERELGYENLNAGDSYIEFNNYVGGMTRGSMISGTKGFQENDTMAVWGKQATNIGSDNYEDIIFNNQAVMYESSVWNYAPKKKWNYTSQYTFYGVFPYSENGLYTVDTSNDFMVTIPTFTTPDDPDKQTDLMISEKRAVIPGNTVDMIFHHILSNVNVVVKLGSTFDGTDIDSVSLLQLKLYNVQNTGSYAQTSWDANNCAEGSWSAQSGNMDMPTVSVNKLSKDNPDTVYKDYLMMPQKLYSTASTPKDVSFDAVFRIFYTDKTSVTHVKSGLRLAGVTGTTGSSSKIISEWEPNYRYNYILAFNPHKSTRVWDADGDGSFQIDPETGDTIERHDDTPTGGTMKYNPDEPDVIYVFEDSDDADNKPDTWKPYPVVWEDVDGDGLLEAGIDRDGDGHIDNVDGENVTEQSPGNDPTKDPTDGDPNNPGGKDVILVHIDSDGDGDIDDNDEWRQIEKDPDTGAIYPDKEIQDDTIEFTASVSEWKETDIINYEISR